MAHMLGLKLGSLFVKTITKPLASRLKVLAEGDTKFRTICHSYGQFHHNIESRITLRLMGHHARTIKKLDENAAVKLGAEFISEAFVFSVAGFLLVFEIQRKSKLDAEKERQKKQKALLAKETREKRFQSLEQRVAELCQQNEKITSELNELKEKKI